MRILRRIIGAILFLSSALGLLGFPSDAPTWYRCLRFGGKACPENMPAINVDPQKAWNVGLLLLGLTLLVPGSWWRLLPRRTAESHAAAPPKLERNAPVVLNGFEFYPGRRWLPPARTLRAQVDSAKEEVWALWNTGTEAFQAKILETGQIKKLLLPHPDEVAPQLAGAEGADPDKIRREIVDLTRLAQRIARDNSLPISVMWYRHAPRNTLMIGDPTSRGYETTWLWIEEFQPTTPSDMRSILRLEGRWFPTSCAAFINYYLNTWNHAAVTPPPLTGPDVDRLFRG